MRAQSTALIGRTVITLGYLIALVVAGSPGQTAVLAGMSLVAVWVAPLALQATWRLGSRAVAPPAVLPPDDGARAA
jgi:hypothetical protein